MDEKIIARNIKKFRLGKEFSLEQLAQLTGLTKGYLSRHLSRSLRPLRSISAFF
jgi:transcriptional regulator with XRE-family HTH domain